MLFFIEKNNTLKKILFFSYNPKNDYSYYLKLVQTKLYVYIFIYVCVKNDNLLTVFKMFEIWFVLLSKIFINNNLMQT